MDGLGLVGELERNDVGVGHAHHHGPGGLGEGAAVGEVGILEVGVPVEVVVDGVVLAAALVFSAEAEIDAGDAEVMDEGGVIGAGAKGGDAGVGAGAELGPEVWRSAEGVGEAGALPNGHLGFRIFNILDDRVDEGFQGV